MTVVACWTRTTKRGAEQLVIAADSRLHGGGYLDAAPKVFCLPRSDAAMAFAGNAYFAYPFILQMIQAIEAHSPLRSRAMDYHKFRTHLLRILNGLVQSFTPLVPILSEPDAAIVLGGYSWFWKEFEIDVLHYSTAEKAFINQSIPHGTAHLGKIVWAGDQAPEGRRRMKELIVGKYGHSVLQREHNHPAKWDWEPLEVIRDMLRDPQRSATIDGAPQIAAVSQHMNSTYYGVRWPNDSGRVFLRGRPLLPYERVDNYHITPDALTLMRPE